MNVFANSSADEVEIREDAHAILRALNAIEVSLRADVDAIEILKHKESTVAEETTNPIDGRDMDAVAASLLETTVENPT